MWHMFTNNSEERAPSIPRAELSHIPENNVKLAKMTSDILR
jgi:hypothetical protein